MQKSALPLVACLLAVAAAGASAQSIWKWRDAGGQMHISDTPPPPNTPEKNILQRPTGSPTPAAAAAPASAAPVAAAGTDDLLKKKQKMDADAAAKAAADKAAQDKKDAAARADNCQHAQEQAQALQSGVRIARVGADGERSFLDDSQRAAELQRAQQIIQQNCNK